MSTPNRAVISKGNKYWISRHRYYELKHFCLQYKEWKEAYAWISSKYPTMNPDEATSDETARVGTLLAYYSSRIDLIEKSAYEAEPEIANYILKAVTQGLSYDYLKTKLEIPCGKDMYYDRYRKFFYILNTAR